MKFFTRLITLTSLLLVAVSSSAITLKYELKELRSFNGEINYPGLDFSNATAATVTIEQDSPDAAQEIKSLEIQFPNATKLTAKDFVKINGSDYRAIVNDAWIYRQVIVEIQNSGSSPFNPYENSQIRLDVAIAEKAGFINETAEERGPILFTLSGELKDITTSKTIDTASLIIDGKRLNLALKSRMGASTSPENGVGQGFVVDALWMGRGEKTLYVNSWFSTTQFNFIKPIGLIIETINTGEGVEHMISIRYKELNGPEYNTSPQPLRELLDRAYPYQPF